MVKNLAYNRSIDLNPHYAYEVDAVISDGEFFYAIFDYGNKLIKANQFSIQGVSTADELGALLDVEGFDKIKFRKAKFGLKNGSYAFIPQKFFDVKDKDTYLKGIYSPTEEDTVLIDENAGYNVVYAMKKEIYQGIRQYFSSPMVMHYSSAVNKTTISDKDYILLDNAGDTGTISIYQDRQLRYSNHCSMATQSDLVYHVLLACQQLGIDRTKTPLYFIGPLAHSQVLKLREYIHEVRPKDVPIRIETNANDVTAADYTPLYSVSKCVL